MIRPDHPRIPSLNKTEDFYRLLQEACKSAKLRERHALVMEMKYGVTIISSKPPEGEWKNTVIAEQLGVTVNRISQIHDAVVRKLQVQAIEEVLSGNSQGPCSQLVFFVDSLRFHNGVWDKTMFYKAARIWFPRGAVDFMIKLGNYQQLHYQLTMSQLMASRRLAALSGKKKKFMEKK